MKVTRGSTENNKKGTSENFFAGAQNLDEIMKINGMQEQKQEFAFTLCPTTID
jgi:hypothetical protein